MANDKDLKIGIEADVDEASFKKGEESFDKVGDSAGGLRGEIDALNAELEEGKKRLDELRNKSLQGNDNDDERDALKRKLDRAAEARDRKQAALEQEENARRATNSKREETKATEELADAEKELETAQKDRKDQANESTTARPVSRPGGADDGGAADLAVLARGATYFAAIGAAVGSANSLMQDFNRELAATGADMEKLRETNPGDFVWIDSINALANPLEAIKDKLGEIAGLDGLRDSAEQAAAMAKKLQEAVVQGERWAKVDNSIRLANLAAELQAVQAVTAAMERRIAVERSARSLAETQARNADQQAVREGVDPNVVKARADARQAVAEITALQEDISVAKRGIEEARAQQSQASDELMRMLSKFGADSPEASAAQDAEIAARDLVDKLTLDVDALQQITANKEAEILTMVEGVFNSAGVDIEAAAAEKGRAVVDQITGTGGALTDLQKIANERLEEILKDGRIVAGEQEGFRQNFALLISGWQADTQAFQALFAEGNAVTSGLASALASQQQELGRLRSQVNQLSGR